jgi:hypothetical protein
MNLKDLHFHAYGNYQFSRPYLLNERHCYLQYQAPNLPYKLVNTLTGLSIDWCPSVTELTTEDWALVIDGKFIE